jgi:hypothetical protein
MPWFLPMLAAGVGATVATKLQNKRDKKAYNAAQAQNEQRREDYYVNLRNDAEKGGFNPLTALRSGGGMGYSNLAGRISAPLMTRSPLAAGISAASNAYTNYSMTRMNQTHDEKMTRLRAQLDRANSLAIHKATTKEIDYSGYQNKIPVKFGHRRFSVPIEIAKRLRIAPDDFVEVGVLTELLGESVDLTSFFAPGATQFMFDLSPLGIMVDGDTFRDEFKSTTKKLTDPKFETKTLIDKKFEDALKGNPFAADILRAITNSGAPM